MNRFTVLAGIIGLFSAVAIALHWFGGMRWEAGTRELRMRLEAALQPIRPTAFDERELEALPEPVARYFRAVLTTGQPLVKAVSIEHSGTFNMEENADRWKPFTSTQRVITRRPAFDWDGRIVLMAGVPVRVHDAYVAGEGILHAALFGLIPLVNRRGTDDLARGELMRFLAEAPWYPTALLPSQGVRWESVDERSSRATLIDGSITVTLLFSFSADGLIDTIRAEARGRTVSDRVVPTPWHCRVWNYERQGGMLVPLDGEVAWLLPEGPKPYWRGHIERINHESARLDPAEN